MDARRTNDPKGWGGVGLTETRHLSLDLPEGWACPHCGEGVRSFIEIEV